MREKSVRNNIELMFTGMDDDVLKECMLATALIKSEEEKDLIIEQLKFKKQEDEKYFKSKFEIEITAEEPEKMRDIFPDPVLETKSDDLVNGDN